MGGRGEYICTPVTISQREQGGLLCARLRTAKSLHYRFLGQTALFPYEVGFFSKKYKNILTGSHPVGRPLTPVGRPQHMDM